MKKRKDDRKAPVVDF
jgi:hypothetical protein